MPCAARFVVDENEYRKIAEGWYS